MSRRIDGKRVRDRRQHAGDFASQDLPHLAFRWGVDPSGNICPFAYNTNRGITGDDMDAKYDRIRSEEAAKGGWIFINESHVDLDEKNVATLREGARYLPPGPGQSPRSLVDEIVRRRAVNNKNRDDAHVKGEVAKLVEAQGKGSEALAASIEALAAALLAGQGKPKKDRPLDENANKGKTP